MLTFSRKLSAIIHRFVLQPDLADRRKFPTARLGKIVVNSVLSIDWTAIRARKTPDMTAEDKAGNDGNIMRINVD
jgi:hypothetical protein